MYQGYINSFYVKNDTGNLNYTEHYNLIMTDTTEFAGSYTRTFLKLGVDAKCIITNDNRLQDKWKIENNFSSGKYSDLIYKQAEDFKPDILWIEDMSYLEKDWFIKVRKELKSVKLILAYHCAPYTKDLLAKLNNADVIITCTPGLKRAFENEGMKAHLVYHGFDSSLLSRIPQNTDTAGMNFVFSGSLITGGSFHNARINLIENLVKEKVDISLYVTLEKQYRIRAKQLIFTFSEILKKLRLGSLKNKFRIFEYGNAPVKTYSPDLLSRNHTPFYGIDMYKLFSRSKIVLNIHIGVAGNYAGNMRIFEVTGVGSCLLTDNKENMKDLFDTEREVVVYDSPEDCIKKVKWLLEHDKEREAIAKAGQKKTLEMHTVENRCKAIIDIINKELSLIRL